MKRSNKSKLPLIDTLEGRMMYSVATPHVVGFLPDYEYSPAMIANLQNAKSQGMASWEGLTQINFFSVLPDSNGLLPGTSVATLSNPSTTTSNGVGYSLSNIDSVVTAAHAAGVKVDIVVGGSDENSKLLTNVVEAGTAVWNNFAASVSQFCAKHGLDGVDIDWEPSAVSNADVQDYGYLLGTLRQNTSGLQLSADVNPEKLPVTSGGSTYVLNAEGVQSLDNINVMAYDLGGPGDGAPIKAAENDATAWATYANSCQTSPTQNFQSKLIFGVPFYGKATTISSSVTNPWSVSNDSNSSSATYNDIVTAAPNSVDYALTDSGNGSISHLSIPGTFGTEAPQTAPAANWNFDDRGTVYAKTTFALQSGFGGVLAWDLGQDYFGSTGYDKNKSLLPAMQQAVSDFTGSQSTQPTQPTVPTLPPLQPEPPMLPMPTGPTTPVPAPTPAPAAGSDTITGVVFNDANGNGNQGHKETGLAGWTVYLDLNNSGTYVAGDPIAITDASGRFTFSNVADGTYIVRVEQQSTYQATTDCAEGGDQVVASDGDTTYCGLFGEQLI